MSEADMTEELLKRLEDTNSKAHEVGYGDHVNPDGPEAAALIRQLQADKERMREAALEAAKYLCRLEGALLEDDLDMKLNFSEESPSDAAESLSPGFNSIKYMVDRAAQSLNQTERGE